MNSIKRRLAATTALALSASTFTYAQPRALNANTAWLDVIPTAAALAAPVPTKNAAGTAGHSTRNAESAEAKARLREGARAAKAFYTQYPNDPRAARAKRLEALAGLKAISDDDDATETEALKVADAFRGDKSNSASDRFDVAWQSERRRVASNARKAKTSVASADLEKVADKLHDEFGDLPRLFEVYRELMRGVDLESANRIAQKLLKWPVPDDVKAAAQAEVNRYQLKGAKIALKLSDTDGNAVPLVKDKATTTLLYLSSRSDQIRVYSPNATPCRWVHLVVDGAPSAADVSRAKADGIITCVIPDGLKGSVAQALSADHVPYVFAVDGNGRIQSYGNPEALAQILAAAKK